VSNVIFTATVSVPDPVTGTTFYGKHHQANLTDEAFVRSLISEGKAALLGATIRRPRVTAVAASTATTEFCAPANITPSTITGLKVGLLPDS